MTEPRIFTRTEVRALLDRLRAHVGQDVLLIALQLEPRLKIPIGHMTGSTFEQRAAAIKRSPSGTMEAVRPTENDP